VINVVVVEVVFGWGVLEAKRRRFCFQFVVLFFSSVVSIYSDLNFTAKERLCGELKYRVNLSLDV
jgi:hypothetical protein